MSMEQCEQQRVRRCASNDQCSSIEREREKRGLVEEGSMIGLDKKGKPMKRHKQGWLFTQTEE